ncbi:hypothetical protein IFM89_011105 [Coptis chinensis]|uniref:ATP-dependent RNA helicase Ski2/MTR4 C-terminal domain-containing protein n=1 Tax=Coptis chinensis TaxID=261450 RepID=A0A835IM59_9MAGN|nr:hypothetical protein IFM89_011105 [Coptis chinensis]
MPARTVVFTNVRKFDGDKFRWISSGEYIQMSGRAGRRGIDQRGICILMVDEKLEPSTAKMMLKGSADCLNSAFHLSYNMLLNQMRCEDGNPENLLRNSFYQFQSDRAIPDLEKQVKALEEERDSIVIEEEESLNDYYHLLREYHKLKKKIRDISFSPRYCLPFLQPAWLVCIQCTRTDDTPAFSTEDEVTCGVIINFERLKGLSEALLACVSFLLLIYCYLFSFEQIASLSSVRIIIPKDLLPFEARENTLKKVSEVLSRYSKEGIPLLDPEDDLKVQNNDYKKKARRVEALEGLFDKHEIANSPLIEQKLKVLHMKKELKLKFKAIRETMRTSTVLAFKDELKARKRVLRRLGYVTSEDVVKLKGKVACEISSADELTLMELMLNGVLKDENVEEMVSLLSCFVWQEKLQDAQKSRDELDLLFTQLQETARRVAEVQLKSNVPIDVEKFVGSFRPDIMEAVYAWAKGSRFYEIMEITHVFEGSLIRRLEEVLQQLILAAKSIGESELETKFEEAVSKIKRDIVFAASLCL